MPRTRPRPSRTQRMTARVVRFRKTRVGALSDARSVSGDRSTGSSRIAVIAGCAPMGAARSTWSSSYVRVGRLVRVVCRGARVLRVIPSSDGDPPSVVRTAHSTPKHTD